MVTFSYLKATVIYNRPTLQSEFSISGFGPIESQAFVIHDNIELLIEDKNSWFETVRAFVGKRLCDDLKEREMLKMPGPKEVRMPCDIIYDAPVEKLNFREGKLVKRQVVAKVPCYLK